MARYLNTDSIEWQDAPVRGGTVMSRGVVWEGGYGVRSAFFRMPEGMAIPEHTHPKWVQVMVLEGEIEVETGTQGTVRIAAGGCYFVEAGETHRERAVGDTLVLVTQGEDRPEFIEATGSGG